MPSEAMPPAADEMPQPEARSPGSSLLVHASLFLATVLSTTVAGAIYVHGGDILPIRDGLPYSIPLLAILVCHEFGHYIAARAHGVPASLPYFIPLPPPFIFGTMGAVIKMGESPADRRKLIDIGAAGPLAGLVVAIAVIIIGLHGSEVAKLTGVGMTEGNSLLYGGLKYAVKGQWLPSEGVDVMLNPTAMAGWVGLLITAINLMPLGQLDGGHIAVAYFGNRWRAIAPRLYRLLPMMGLVAATWVAFETFVPLDHPDHPLHADRLAFTLANAFQAGAPWLVFFVLLKFLRRVAGGQEHPPVDALPLPRSRAVLFWVVAVAFVSIFMPVLLRQSVPPADASEQELRSAAATPSADEPVDEVGAPSGP